MTDKQTEALKLALEALKGLLEDTEHKHHSCGDEDWCPVLRARAALAKASGSATQTGETE